MIVVRTPLRLSFVGGGSDMKAFYDQQDGMVISSAIDKFVYVIIKKRFDDKIYINYSRKECVDSIDEIEHDLVRESMRMTGVSKGVEITTLADIPSAGSGLGSSSSVTVGLLHALYAYQNILVTAEQLASEACQIEIDLVDKPIGRQDQYAAAFGDVNLFGFHNGDTVTRKLVKIDNDKLRIFSSNLLLYYTGITRKADEILSRQEQGVSGYEKAAIMADMVGLVKPFRDVLQAGDITECGRLIDLNWQMKQQLASGISNEKIETMYNMAKQAGALAGKVVGAGGGGFLLLLVPREKQNQVFDAMADFRELPFALERSGSNVIFNDRRYLA